MTNAWNGLQKFDTGIALGFKSQTDFIPTHLPVQNAQLPTQIMDHVLRDLGQF